MKLKIIKFCQLHETKPKIWDFANFMKLCKNYEIFQTSWKYGKIMKFTSRKCAKTEIFQTSGKYTRIMKTCTNSEILKFSYCHETAKILKFCQLYDNMQNLWKLSYFMKIWKNEIFPTTWKYG